MIKRLSISAIGGLGVTVGLGLIMSALIAGEFEAEAKVDGLKFDINPQVVEPPVIRKPKKAEQLQPVDVPPAVPRVNLSQTDQPIEAPFDAEDTGPFIEPPVITTVNWVMNVSDADALPVLRPEPIMPPQAEKSGHCKVAFDVNAEGLPYNIETPFCTERIFKRASIKAVQKWRFTPKIQDGQPVARQGVRNQITFQLLDERGQLIPE